MKKYLLLVLIATVCIVSVTDAQIKKGATFLGGDISGNTSRTKAADTVYSKQKGFTISPVFGKAIRENVVLGVDLIAMTSLNETGGGTSEQKNRAYGGGIFLRKYKQLGNSGFSIFAQGRLGVRFDRYETNSTNATYSDVTKTFNTTLSAYPGMSYTISKKLQLEIGFYDLLAINYASSKRTVTDSQVNEYKTTGFSLSSSLDNFSPFYLGFRLLLN
ncbi:MAG: hypothetical protein ACTHMV_05220 [Chitinophagaceae bacterium]